MVTTPALEYKVRLTHLSCFYMIKFWPWKVKRFDHERGVYLLCLLNTYIIIQYLQYLHTCLLKTYNNSYLNTYIRAVKN